MISYPFKGPLMNAYCADLGAARPNIQPKHVPFLARNSSLTETQAREADRLRKMKDRIPDTEAVSLGSKKMRAFFTQLLDHWADRTDRKEAKRFNLADLDASLNTFQEKYALSFDEFAKWCGGPTSLLLGMEVSRSGTSAPGSNTSRALFASFIEAFSEPERNGLALEQGKIPEKDLIKTCLKGLPEGTALQRYVERETSLDAERLGRLAFQTGMMWQLALVSAAAAAPGEEDNPILNPTPQSTENGGQRWSSGPAWVAAVAEFERAHHSAPRTGSRGPTSVARQIHTLLAKHPDGANGSENIVRKLNGVLSGQKPLTFKVVEDICRTIEAAEGSPPDGTLQSALSDDGDAKWENELLRLRIYGHIAGFMSYIERVWEYASRKLDNPTLLQDLHDVWQDWPQIYDSALDNHRKRLAEFGL
ncbi:hypothetical protein [Ruegeria sp. THAF33]|uniref:hypothetical protein n=1 Tax=Ruegeria sp. THAF33 TaxID=2587853 RepID=UPI0012678538|nr:hypothetical protein [Ruegeria sp. THAF33]QFT74935.1 hypothetical protein FIU92_17995 [Ruegeria sp. THAF33]